MKNTLITSNIDFGIGWQFLTLGGTIVWMIMGILIVFCQNSAQKQNILIFSFFSMFVPALNALSNWYFFDKTALGFQYIYQLPLLKQYNIDFILGLDGISLCFLLLTVFTFPLCWLSATTISYKFQDFILYLLLIELFLILSFTVIDLLFFYVFFESVLIPMFLIISIWGARSRKIKAAYYFFLYTLFGSLFMLFGIFYLYSITKTTDFRIILNTKFSETQQLYLWICFFLPFAIKIPMFPFHIWLPEAHVEAPTIGSVILASLLLKLGSYGFLRFTLPMLPYANAYFSPIIYTAATLSIIYASLVTIRQIDLKRIIAYSSIAHMNLIVLGLFSYTQQGIDGAIYLMIAHGIVSSALFFCVGVLYDRHHTRLIRYYGGLVQVMPIYSTFLFLFSLANMSFPGTSNFIGEFLILIGLFEKNSFVLIFAGTGIVLSAVYSIWLYNRIIFGTLKTRYIKNFQDVTNIEYYILIIYIIAMFFLGFFSNPICSLTQSYTYFLPIK